MQKYLDVSDILYFREGRATHAKLRWANAVAGIQVIVETRLGLVEKELVKITWSLGG